MHLAIHFPSECLFAPYTQKIIFTPIHCPFSWCHGSPVMNAIVQLECCNLEEVKQTLPDTLAVTETQYNTTMETLQPETQHFWLSTNKTSEGYDATSWQPYPIDSSTESVQDRQFDCYDYPGTSTNQFKNSPKPSAWTQHPSKTSCNSRSFTARLAWARRHKRFLLQDWNILFNDESRFHLDSHDGRLRAYRRPGERFSYSCVIECRAFGGGSVMVWGGITPTGRTALQFVYGNDIRQIPWWDPPAACDSILPGS